MPLSSDQLSELRSALADAHREMPPAARNRMRRAVTTKATAAVQPALTPENRRHAQRIRERCNAEVSEWHGNRAGATFGVVVEDISTTGVGLLHSGRLKVGQQYLLEIPRPRRAPLAFLFTVVRCAQRDGGLFDVQISPDEILSVTADHARHAEADASIATTARTNSKRLRSAVLALAFAVAVAAVFSGVIDRVSLSALQFLSPTSLTSKH